MLADVSHRCRITYRPTPTQPEHDLPLVLALPRHDRVFLLPLVTKTAARGGEGQ